MNTFTQLIYVQDILREVDKEIYYFQKKNDPNPYETICGSLLRYQK